MAFVSDFSCECVKTELDIFAVPPTQTSIQQAEWVEYQPSTSILGNAPIELGVVGPEKSKWICRTSCYTCEQK